MDASAAIPAVLITILLVLTNGFFVAAEYSFVRVRDTQVDELAAAGSGVAKLAARIGDRLDEYIAAAQLGVTLASLAIGWIGEPAVASLIEPLFGWLRAMSEPAFHLVAFGIAFLAITYLHVVIGELSPKYLAIQRALRVALICAYPLDLFYRIVRPFNWLVFADTVVRQVMVPRTEIVAVPEDLDLSGLIAMARQTRFSRFPVYRDKLDHIVGVIHVKDLVGVDRTSRALAHDLMRRVPFIPETLRLDQALAEFRRQRAGLAVVIDEFGGTAGLVTLEDVLEQLVGEVRDEFEAGEVPRIREEGPGVYVVDGLVALDDLRDRLGLNLADEAYDTVRGLVFGRLGRVARIGDTVAAEGYRFAATGVAGR